MPSTATVTAFYTFVPLTKIRSAHVNNNFDVLRGHSLPLNTDTATSSNLTHDLGANGHAWRGVYNQYGVMYGNTTSSIPSTPASGYYALYFKNDGALYSKDSAGAETQISGGGLSSISGVTTQRLLGRYSAGTGTAEQISIGNGLYLNSSGELGLQQDMVDSLTLGERVVTDLSSIIVLGAYITGSTKATFRQPNGSAGYVVPTGSSFEVLGVTMHAVVAAAAPVTLAYADNDLGFNSAGSFTNPVYLFGDSSYTIFRNPGQSPTSLAPGKPTSFAVNFTVPAGKYVQLYHAAGGANSIHVILWGKLV